MKGQDPLGDRIKADYENRTRFSLPRRTYTVIRVDGRAFHTFTRDCVRPFDYQLMRAMDETARALCEQIQGACLAYVQSDEISVVLTDFAKSRSEAWFDGTIQKMASVSASIATAAFNREWLREWLKSGRAFEEYEFAQFDSRIFTIPDRAEVFTYLGWRQLDATRNSVQMAAIACFRPEEVHGKSRNELQEMLFQGKQINWNDYPAGAKRGRVVVPITRKFDTEYVDGRTGETRVARGVKRRSWEIVEPPVFQRNREWLEERVPRPG